MGGLFDNYRRFLGYGVLVGITFLGLDISKLYLSSQWDTLAVFALEYFKLYQADEMKMFPMVAVFTMPAYFAIGIKISDYILSIDGFGRKVIFYIIMVFPALLLSILVMATTIFVADLLFDFLKNL